MGTVLRGGFYTDGGRRKKLRQDIDVYLDMCEYADEQTDGQMPDCLWNCPFEGSDWADPSVKTQCIECWNTVIEPYRSYTELFMVALDFLEREDISLHHPGLLTPREEMAILLVRRLMKKEEFLKMRDKMQKYEKDLKKVADVRDQKHLEG